MAKTKISQFDATAANNTDLNSISIAEGTAPSNINNAIRELMSQLADLNLGNEVLSTLKIDNLHLDGNTIVTLDTNGDLNLTPNGTGSVVVAKVDINGGAIDGTPIGGSSASTGAFTTLSASSTANLGSSVTVSGGNIDGVIGANTPAAITGTVITANTNFAGNLTGNVTGTVDGVVGGTTPAAITGTTITANTKFVGAIDGNVTATSGTSTFNNVTINGTLDMDSTTSQTITGLATPSNSTDAATKGYVDTEVSALVDSAPSTLNTLNELAAALGDDASFSTTVTNSIAAKLPLAGGTMTGDINLDSNSLTNLAAPSNNNDAARKAYVDTADALKLNLSGGTLSGNIAMGDNKITGLAAPTADNDAARKKYVDDIAGSGTAAATSASQAATSATNAANSATASANSATSAASSATSAAASFDSFDDRYLGAKSSAPSTDNDGDALVTGALYWNTSSNDLYVWNGSAWEQGAFSTGGVLSNVVEDTTPQLGGDLDAQGKDIEDVGIVSADGIAGIYGSTSSPVTYTVTVASKTAAHPYNGDGSSSAYFLNGIESPALQLQGVDGTTANTEYFYKFDQSHSSNSGHPLRFYKDAAKAEAYTTGVTTNGTAGSSGAYTTIAVDDATPNVLYYECSSHAYMGNYVTTPATSVQGLDAELTAIAGLTSAADKGIQFTGSGTAGTYDLTAAGKALLDDADAAAQRTTLGLGSAATLTAGTSASNLVQLDGSAKLPAVDGSALTGLASGGTVNMVADGAIAIRKPVILTAAGKAKEVAESVGSDISVAFTTMDDSDTVSSDGEAHMVYDSTSETFVAVYENAAGSDYPHAVAGTWSDGSITWGTPVVLQSAGCNREIGIAVGNGKVWTSWARNADTPNIYITSLSISGTAITVATPTDTSIAYSNELGIKLSYDISSDYLLLFNSNQSTGSWLFKVVPYYTTSGGGLTAGASSTILNNYVHHDAFDVVYDPDTSRTIVVYNETAASPNDVGLAKVIQSSGTTGSPTVTIGSSAGFSGTDRVGGLAATYDTANDKVFISYHDKTNDITKGIIGTVTGGGTNSISFAGGGTINDGTNYSSAYQDVVYDSDASKIITIYRDDDHTSDGLTYRVITSGASSFSVSSAAVISTNDNQLQSGAAAFGAGKGTAVATRDTDNSSKLSISTLYYPLETNLNNGNYLGIAAEAISDTATGKINVIGGTSTGHSSLTIGNHYFTNGAGTIGLVGNTTGEQYLGRAISATEIQLLENEGYLYGTAEGAITAGKPVIVEADGDFAQAKTTTNSISFSQSSITSIQASVTSTYGFTSYNTAQDKFVCFYEDRAASSYLYGNVISNDGTTLTAGSKSSAGNNFNTRILSVIYIGDSKHIIFMRNDDNNYFAAVVATVSGTSISYGTVNTFHSYGNHYVGSAYWDSDKNVAVFVGCYNSSSKNLAAYSFTVSGTTLTQTAGPVDNSQGTVDWVDNCYDSTNKIGVVAYTDGSDDGYVTTLSASSAGALTWNTAGEAQISGSDNIELSGYAMTYDSVNEKTILGYTLSSNGYLYTRPITLSGNPATTVAIGSASDVSGQDVFSQDFSAIATDYGTVVYTWIKAGDYAYIKYKEGDASGSTISIGSLVNLVYSGTYYDAPPLAFNPTDNVVVGAFRNGGDDDVDALAFIPSGSESSTNLTAENYLGVATKTVADDAQVEVATFGQIDAQQSGLTAGQKYFVQSDGSLGTSADSSVTTVAGKALSATKLLISE